MTKQQEEDFFQINNDVERNFNVPHELAPRESPLRRRLSLIPSGKYARRRKSNMPSVPSDSSTLKNQRWEMFVWGENSNGELATGKSIVNEPLPKKEPIFHKRPANHYRSN